VGAGQSLIPQLDSLPCSNSPRSIPSSLSVHLQDGELFSRCKGQRSMAPLELSRRMDCITRGSRLLWLKWSTSRCCSVRRMLRPFSTSRLPACHCPLVRFERDVLTSAAGRVQAFARSVSLGEPFDRLPLCQPRNAPFRTGYYTWRVSSHGSRHYYLRDRWRQSANGAVKHTKFLVFHFLRPLAKHVMTSRHVSARPNPDRSRGSDSGAYTHLRGP
jgi:hypothetical protein